MAPENLADDAAVEEAIAAFDAGNHAWGRYRHFVLPGAAAAAALNLPSDAVRSALQEAAICVADARTGEIGPFVAALSAAYAGLTRYRALLPAEVPPGEVNEALGDIEEALALLAGRLPPA